jgi:hypothetical protein
MKKINFDIYKLLLLCIASLFTYYYIENSKIGRFIPLTANGAILDTKSGAIYLNQNSDSSKLVVKSILK